MGRRVDSRGGVRARSVDSGCQGGAGPQGVSGDSPRPRRRGRSHISGCSSFSTSGVALCVCRPPVLNSVNMASLRVQLEKAGRNQAPGLSTRGLSTGGAAWTGATRSRHRAVGGGRGQWLSTRWVIVPAQDRGQKLSTQGRDPEAWTVAVHRVPAREFRVSGLGFRV